MTAQPRSQPVRDDAEGHWCRDRCSAGENGDVDVARLRGDFGEQASLADTAFPDEEHAPRRTILRIAHTSAQRFDLDRAADHHGGTGQPATKAHRRESCLWERSRLVVLRMSVGPCGSMITDTQPAKPDRSMPMSFEEVMAAVMRWTNATEALAALGAELSLAQTGETPPPEIAAALRAVSTAAGVPAIEDLAPQQRAVALGVIHLYVHQALDMLAEPSRAPGWTFTDPFILDGWGRGSTMVPAMIAAAHPDLAEVTSFLDVGTGVGLLA